VSGRRLRRSAAGFSLVELLVAMIVAGITLAAAYGWLWNMAPAAQALGRDAQARSGAAFALRSVTADLQQAEAVCTPVATTADRGLLTRQQGPDAAAATVPVVWDADRQVLWRKTSATYLADHVTRFQVAYFDAWGQPLSPGTPGQPLRGVARVHVLVEVQAAQRTFAASTDVMLRCP
jgi:prepilin-type N-terminal cleavage/methylation domain-containing protein